MATVDSDRASEGTGRGGVSWPAGNAEAHAERAFQLWAQARAATSPEARAEFARLARLYERLAERAERREHPPANDETEV
jgi:hypothetical protein